MGSKCIGPNERIELVAEATQYTAQVGSHQGTVSSHRMRATPIRSRRAIREKFLKKRLAGSDTWLVRTRVTWVATWLDFSVKISETDSPAFPMWGSRRALPYARTHPWPRTMDSRRMG